MAGITWWTEDRWEVLKSLAAEGLTAREIARRLSRRHRRHLTPEAVRLAAARLDISLLARGGHPPKKK
jgi:hypothetical protein